MSRRTLPFKPHAAAPHRIDMVLRTMEQFFNSMDPSPFHEKDLDRDAQEYIVSTARLFPPSAPVALRIHLEQWPAADPRGQIRDAVHSYFAYRTKLNRLAFQHLMRQGRISLLIGLVFLTACLFSRELLLGRTETWAHLIQESASIVGWVGMWRPIGIYLYDWWPLRREGRMYARLSSMPVEVLRAGESGGEQK